MSRDKSNIKEEYESQLHKLNKWMLITFYFKKSQTDVPLFFIPNSDFIFLVQQEMNVIRKARDSDQKIKIPTKSLEILRLERRREADKSILQKMFLERFEEAKRDYGYITHSRFAKDESGRLSGIYKEQFAWFPILEQWIEFLDEKSGTESISQKFDSIIPICGFSSKLTTKQITDLYDLLVGEYMEQETSLTHFKSIFTTQPVPQGFKPIKRKRRVTKVLLGYLIKQLFYEDNKNIWKKTAMLFDNASNMAQNMNITSPPKGHEDVDHILNTIINS